MRYIFPIILIGIAIAGFFMFIGPMYSQVQGLQAQIVSYDQALTNSKTLGDQRDKLVAKNNAMSATDINKLSVMLPNSVDNIRLILEIETIASRYGMGIKDVKYSTDKKDTLASAATTLQPAASSKKDYGDWDLEFSTTGTYANFLDFTKDLEQNLRIVDITSVAFSSDSISTLGLNMASTANDSYKFNFKIKTYWLKN